MSIGRAEQSAAVGDVITANRTVTSSAVQHSSLATINKAPAEQLGTNGGWMNSV